MLTLEPIKLDCTFEERTSKKDNTTRYKCLVIRLSNNYEKVIFLTIPEVALIESNR